MRVRSVNRGLKRGRSVAAERIRSVPDYVSIVMEEYRFLRGENGQLVNQLHTFSLTGAATFLASAGAALLSLAFGGPDQRVIIAYFLSCVLGGLSSCWYMAICSSIFVRYLRNANYIRVIIEEKVSVAFRSGVIDLASPGTAWEQEPPLEWESRLLTDGDRFPRTSAFYYWLLGGLALVPVLAVGVSVLGLAVERSESGLGSIPESALVFGLIANAVALVLVGSISYRAYSRVKPTA